MCIFQDVVILCSWKLVCVIAFDILYECDTFDSQQLNKANQYNGHANYSKRNVTNIAHCFKVYISLVGFFHI